MSGTRYRRGGLYAADMAVYARALSEENTNADTMKTLRENVLIAIRQELTGKQREYIQLYYAEGLNMSQIGERVGVDKSTVSRTIKGRPTFAGVCGSERPTCWTKLVSRPHTIR